MHGKSTDRVTSFDRESWGLENSVSKVLQQETHLLVGQIDILLALVVVGCACSPAVKAWLVNPTPQKIKMPMGQVGEFVEQVSDVANQTRGIRCYQSRLDGGQNKGPK